MKLSDVKSFLAHRETLLFTLPDGTRVPAHFHVTEVGEVDKTFIDCGGTLRRERKAVLQLWSANDYDHRLHPGKLRDIIKLAEGRLGLADLEVEVEYQGKSTVESYSLTATEEGLLLTGQQTDCLAKDQCGIPTQTTPASSCTPSSGCC
jgi:hypothetical protein